VGKPCAKLDAPAPGWQHLKLCGRQLQCTCNSELSSGAAWSLPKLRALFVSFAATEIAENHICQLRTAPYITETDGDAMEGQCPTCLVLG